jgi:urease accessory protein
MTTTVAANRARSVLDARAAVRVDAGSRGAVLTTLRCQVPLVMRRTTDDPALPGRAGLTIHLVGAGAGPLAGDQLVLDIEVGPGARLTLRSAAATVALPGRGDEPSRLLVRARVGAGGTLEYLPEPTVAAAGCRHRMDAEVTLGPGASLLWRDELLLGRHGENSGAITTSLRVDLRGNDLGGDEPRPLLRHELALGPDEPGRDGPAVLGGARAVGTLLIAGAGLVPSDGAARAGQGWATTKAAVLALAGPGALVTALADDAVALRRALDAGYRQVLDRPGGQR